MVLATPENMRNLEDMEDPATSAEKIEFRAKGSENDQTTECPLCKKQYKGRREVLSHVTQF